MAELEGQVDRRLAVQQEFLRHSEVVKGFIRALVPRTADADDLFQEVFLTVLAKAEDYTPGTRFTAWARAIARNKIRKHFSQRGTRCLSFDPDVLDALDVDADDYERDWSVHKEILGRCLHALGDAARKLLDLRYVARLTPAVIAARLRRSPNGVSVALSKAHGALRRCVLRELHQRGLSP